MFTLTKAFDDQSEMDKGKEHYVELLESGKDSAKAFEAAEKPFYFIASSIHDSVVFPSGDSVLFGRDDRDKSEVQCQLAGFVALVGAVHEQVNRPCCRSQLGQQFSSFGRIVGLTRRKRELYSRSVIRGNQMNFGGPSATRFSDRLWAVFFNAPVPSGCTLTAVLSRDTASILMRTI